jgi:hypothetical protein
MPKTSINPESDEAVTTTLSKTESAAMAQTPSGYDADQYDDPTRDISTPVLGLVNKVGKPSKQWPKNVGELYLGDSIIGETVRAIPVGIVKFFVESCRDGQVLKFGGDIIPKVFSSATEAAAAGYVLDFDNVARNRVEEAAKIGWLVLKPEGFDDEAGEFVLDMPSGAVAAVAKTTVKRGGYRGTFKPIYNYAVKMLRASGGQLQPTASETFLKAGGFKSVWDITVDHCEGGDNDWYELRARRVSSLSDIDLDWVKEQMPSISIL